MFAGKTILITGGTGSFGNAVLERFLDTDVGEIRIFSRDEKKQDEMRYRYKSDKVSYHIGDVREYRSIRRAMEGVDLVFSAAALKQVPSCEFFPMEAVKTNVIGTGNVLDASIDAGVEKVICLSTDKAVYPINAMGISKAMMEKVFVARSRTALDTLICGTRYGNVLCSRGSVVPLFVEQIKAGKPLTVTEPSMTRFLMSLDEAVDLVLYAFRNATSGDILVQKAPASTIGDLAQAVKEIFRSDAPVNTIGIRHGEKMYETLLSKEERKNALEFDGFFHVPADNRTLDYERYQKSVGGGLETEFNSDNTTRLSVEEVKQKLLGLKYIQREVRSYERNR